VTDLVFLSDSSALVCGVRGGQVVVLGVSICTVVPVKQVT
jgi:hypothetical protein